MEIDLKKYSTAVDLKEKKKIVTGARVAWLPPYINKYSVWAAARVWRCAPPPLAAGLWRHVQPSDKYDPARHSPDTACQTARVPIRRRLHPLGVERARLGDCRLGRSRPLPVLLA